MSKMQQAKVEPKAMAEAMHAGRPPLDDQAADA